MRSTNAPKFLAAGLACLAGFAPALAQQAGDAGTPAAPKVNDGLVPLPDFTGDLSTRRVLTGDWGGARSNLAAHGLQLNLELTQWTQGVVAGGRRIDWDAGASFDVAGTFDLMRAGLVPGGLLVFRAESRVGETVNDDAGTLLPVNADGGLPITGSVNESILTITQLNYVQYFSEKFAVSAGKVQTLDGDPNEFAGGRGATQFMNFSMIANPVAARTIPYSTLAAGILVMPTKTITISSTLLNTTDSSTTSGFDHIEDGWTWVTEADFQYKLGELPGGFNLGGTYAFANDFARLNGKYVTGSGIALPRESDSWCVYTSAWQYLYSPDKAPDVINLQNGKPDIRGIGLFTRIGFGDNDTNPADWSASGGFGGRGLIPSRDNDVWGAGYIYTSLVSTRIGTLLNLPGSTQGFEAYYSFAITPAVDLTLDAQWFEGASPDLDAATLLGARFDVRF